MSSSQDRYETAFRFIVYLGATVMVVLLSASMVASVCLEVVAYFSPPPRPKPVVATPEPTIVLPPPAVSLSNQETIVPCNSHPDDTSDFHRLCVALSKIHCVLGELDGRRVTPEDWRLVHVYPGEDLDAVTAQACRRLQDVDPTQYSLELQIWWRDHQEWDRQRKAEEARQEAERILRESALAKLTPEERAALGY